MTRPPIAVVLGHVDHGKSSLLEAIREDFKITSKESGGITQHIGAYVAEYQGKRITFLDTPGHEAFSAMRSRGASVADVAILVVAADDGVKEQTKEAIRVIKEAGIPMVVAVNKIDKPEANLEKAKRELSQNNVFVESFGGEVPYVATSALTKQGIGELLEMVLLLGDMTNLQANPLARARGVVIETALDSRRGNAATLLVKDGTLKIGDIVATKNAWGKAKILQDFEGNPVGEAPPSFPVLLIGFQEYPRVGEEFQVCENEAEARSLLAPEQKREKAESSLREDQAAFPVILKADVAGSLEALEGMLSALPQERIVLRAVHSGIGDITEGDVRLAQGTNARIFGFRTKAEAGAQELAQRENIPIETFDVIYDLVQRAREVMEKTQEAKLIRKDLGSMRVLAVFLREKERQIVGGRVLEGEVRKGSSVDVMREEQLAGQGRVLNVQKNKQDADAAFKGDECGILFAGPVEVQAGDVLQFHVLAPDTI